MLPNGTQALAISCPGAARDVAACMNKAAHACGGPYQMLDRDGVVSGAMPPAGSGAAYMGAVHRTLLIKCGTG
jgi:GH15 family glucan-1,4-alpha-glucosidase